MKVSEIAELLHGTSAGDAGRAITGVAALETAGPAELAFVEGPRALEQAAASQAGCLLVPEGASLPGHTTITVRHPKLALIRAAEALHPAPLPPPGIHPTAVVAAGRATGAGLLRGPARGDRKRSLRGRGNPALPRASSSAQACAWGRTAFCIPTSPSIPARKSATASFSTRAW